LEIVMTWPSVPIKVDGGFVGATLPQEKGVRFIATDWRVAEMDQTVWRTPEEARCAAEQMVRTGQVSNFTPTPIEE
jgi:hypothetical protein